MGSWVGAGEASHTDSVGNDAELPEPADGSMSRPSSAAGLGSGHDSKVADYTRNF